MGQLLSSSSATAVHLLELARKYVFGHAGGGRSCGYAFSAACHACGKRYELLPGVNRADKETCSQTCRTRVYRQRKQRALALHPEGKTARAIARELEAKVDAVRKWITSGGTRLWVGGGRR
jgi:hypothetical protein